MAAMHVLRWVQTGLLCSLLLAGAGSLSAASQDGLLESLLPRLSFPLAGAPARTQAELQVTDVAVAFDVVNVNRSGVPCLADGGRYRVNGHLVYPTGAQVPDATTLYLHGFGWGEFFWRLEELSELNFAQAMARLGHASVVIDRLGYDASDHPAGGFATCLGSQADIAHQIVQQLRAGAYVLAGATDPPRFGRVALAGHSAAGAIVEIAAYSFGDINALAILGWADTGASPGAVLALVGSTLGCLLGGEPAEPGLPAGYAFFGQRAEDFLALEVFDAEPRVREIVVQRRNRDPCGDLNSSALALAANVTHLGLLRDIRIPTLLLCGNQDAVFPPLTCRLQQTLLNGVDDLTSVFLEGIGHGLTLERRAPEFREQLSRWLRARGF